MFRLACWALLTLGLIGSATLADPPEDTVKERKAYIPYRKYVAVPGTVVGIFATETAPVLSTEGRGSAADIYGFGADGNSYRWVYVPSDNPEITNLQVPVPGNKKRFYAFLSMARPASVKHWGVSAPFALVQLDVNNGDGSPVNDSFVATHAKQLDGTKEYPLNVADTIALLKKDYAEWCKKKGKDIEQALKQSEEKALKNQKPTGPREPNDLMFVTWMTGSKELVVRFRTKISDGHFNVIEGGGFERPFPLPVPPNRKLPPPQANPPATPQALPPGALAFPPPPPPRFKMKVGTAFGVEFGRVYVVNVKGAIVRTEFLPFEPFQNNLQQQQGFDRPLPLPPPPPPLPDVKRD